MALTVEPVPEGADCALTRMSQIGDLALQNERFICKFFVSNNDLTQLTP
jgi:hypothetical protein